jgi:hypothetical protein
VIGVAIITRPHKRSAAFFFRRKKTTRTTKTTSLKSYKNEIDDSLVPQSNVDAAKKVIASMGDDFTPEVMKKKSNAAAGLTEWIINIVMYSKTHKKR